MPRHRLEDLGRISVMIRSLINEIEELEKPLRAKDGVEWFSLKNEEQQEDLIHKWCYASEDNLNKLYDILSIAEGRDELNDRDNSNT